MNDSSHPHDNPDFWSRGSLPYMEVHSLAVGQDQCFRILTRPLPVNLHWIDKEVAQTKRGKGRTLPHMKENCLHCPHNYARWGYCYAEHHIRELDQSKGEWKQMRERCILELPGLAVAELVQLEYRTRNVVFRKFGRGRHSAYKVFLKDSTEPLLPFVDFDVRPYLLRMWNLSGMSYDLIDWDDVDERRMNIVSNELDTDGEEGRQSA
jgi:hypothetical protein